MPFTEYSIPGQIFFSQVQNTHSPAYVALQGMDAMQECWRQNWSFPSRPHKSSTLHKERLLLTQGATQILTVKGLTLTG